MIRTERVSSSKLQGGDQRLDGWFFCSPGALAHRVFQDTGLQTESLADVCDSDGVFIPHRFKRPYVSDAAHGIPYLTGSSIFLSDPLTAPLFLSSNPRLLRQRGQLELGPGMILITCSGQLGSIGRVVYGTRLLKGTVGSPDLLRVVPNRERIPPGYLYAYLASPIGRGLLTRGTYGGVIPHIEAAHVVGLPVARLESEIEKAIHELVEAAAEKRASANILLNQARDLVYEVTSLPKLEHPQIGRNLRSVRSFSVPASELGTRFEARFHDIVVRDMEALIRGNASCNSAILGDCAEVWLPNRGKWANVEVGGIPLVDSGEMFASRPTAGRYVSARLSPGVSGLTVNLGDVLVARSGQINSILGNVALVGRTLVRNAVTEDAIRVRVRSDYIASSYLFAFLSLPDYGYGQLVRTAYGTSIPHLSVPDLQRLAVPVPEEPDRERVGRLVVDAVELRDQANDDEDAAQILLARALEDETGASWAVLTGARGAA